MPDLDVALRLRADASGLVGEVRLSERELRRLGLQAERAGGRARLAGRLWSGFGREMEATRRRATGLRLAMTALATGVGVRVAGSFLEAASSAEELRSQFDAVFRGLSGEARQWAQVHADAVGRSTLDIEAYLATLQDTFVPLGFARREAFELSRTLTQLGVDLASFKNAAEPETIDLLTSAIVGNHEAVRRFGIVITESTLNQELLNAGFERGVKGATDLQKVMARVRIILRSTSDAQGDAARTADQYANRVRALTGDWRDFQTFFGSSLIPTAQDGIAILRSVLTELQEGADPEALGRELQARFRSILLGTAAAADALAVPLNVAKTVIVEIVEGFNALPPWVREIGVLGAVLFGRRGRLALLATIAIGEIVGEIGDRSQRRVEELERTIGNLENKLERSRAGTSAPFGPEGTITRQLENALEQAQRQLELARAAERLRPREDTGPTIGISGGSLFGRGRAEEGQSLVDQLEELFLRFDAESERRQPPERQPLPLPAIPRGAAAGAGTGLRTIAEINKAELDVLAAVSEDVFRQVREDHLETVRAIDSAELDLASPFERAIVEANRWRDETLAGLDRTSDDYEKQAVRIEEVYFARINRAAFEAAEEQRKAAERARSG